MVVGLKISEDIWKEEWQICGGNGQKMPIGEGDDRVESFGEREGNMMAKLLLLKINNYKYYVLLSN